MIRLSAKLPFNDTVEYLDVDTIMQEKFDFGATITDHPVEVGSDVSDNIRPEPEQMTIEVVQSNSPLTPGLIKFKMDPARGANAVDRLVRWQRIGALISYTSTLGSRSDMAIKSISTMKDAKSAGGSRISLSLKKIRFVSNKLTTLTVSKDPRVSNKVKEGDQGSKKTNFEDASQLYSIDGVKDVLQSLARPQFSSAATDG